MRSRTTRLVFESVLVIVVLGRLDLFGLAAETDRLSSAVVQRTAASFYRVWSDPRTESPPRSPVTVIEIDETFLGHVDASWPLAYSAYAHLLHRIARQQPKAIFLDLFLSQDRGDAAGLEVLVETIAALSAAGIPLFVAAPDPCTTTAHDEAQHDALAPGRGLLQDIVRTARPVVVEWSGFRDAYPLVLDPADVRAPDADARCASTAGAWHTPALALFDAWCDGTGDPRCTWRATAGARRAFVAPMAVQWGVAVDERNGAFSSLDACGLTGPHLDDRAAWSLWSLGAQLRRGLSGAGVGSLERCPFAPTVSASVLYASDDDGTFVSDENHDEHLREWFHGRLVLVGAALRGTGDVVRSPVHGQLAGVHLHAMALDNLLAYGERYVVDAADPRAPARPRLDALWALLAISILVIFGRFEDRRIDAMRSCDRLPRRVLGLAATFAFFGVMFLVTLVVVLVVSIATETSVPNWIGILAGATVSLPELTVCALLGVPDTEREAGASQQTEASARVAEGEAR